MSPRGAAPASCGSRRCIATRFAETIRRTAEVADGISDLQFTDAYRVPFQYSRFVREHLQAGAFVQSSSGVTVTDLDGNRFYDLTGSYGVNLFGNDFYKECMARGARARARSRPGARPLSSGGRRQCRRLHAISGLDEVSFHMSGTEAVMQAVRLARYHTRRRTWCASAAPITAGGATCSPASAIRCRRARPTR